MRPFLRPSWPTRTSQSVLAWLPRTTPHCIPRRIATTSARNAAPVDLPNLIVSPGSKHHNSLPSFLEYAERTRLALTSTVAIGTCYEYTSALVLMRLGFSLLRIGSKDDAGIDLIGHWVLAPLREPMPVIVQCKSRKINCGPSQVRELEGSFQGIPPDWRNKDVLGLLVTTKKATMGVLRAVGQSQWPMGFVLISRQGLIEQFVWNKAAAEKGLQGVGVTVRHTPRALLAEPEEEEEEPEEDSTKTSKQSRAKFKNAGTQRDIQLTWMGSPIFPGRDSLDQETLKLIRQIAPKEEDAPVVVEVEKRRPGRPKGATKEACAKKNKPSTVARCPKKWSERLPTPRGGQIPLVVKEPSRGHVTGRPAGSKSKPKPPGTPRASPKPAGKRIAGRPRGRPPGSKNKPKAPVDIG